MSYSAEAEKTFYADEKFEEVIKQLESQGWVRSQDNLNCNLIWTNLRNVDFDSLNTFKKSDEFYSNSTRCLVNHYKGAQHLSNKAFFSFHIHASGLNANNFPLTWSPSYQNVDDLIGMLLSNYDSLMPESEANCTATEDFLMCKALQKVVIQLRESFERTTDFSFLVQIIENALRLLESQQHNNILSSSAWIIKPVGMSCGKGIKITRGLRNTLLTAREFAFKCVVQKYLMRPMLLEGRKFDIRQWLLITSLWPLEIYGFSEGYLRRSASIYSSSCDSFDPLMHLTNHSIQKASMEKEDNNFQSDCSTMMSQEEFDLKYLHGKFCSIVLPKIQDACLNSIFATRDKLSPNDSCFEWLGVDLLVEGSLDTGIEVSVLEVNVSPDISHSTPITSRLVPPAVADLLSLLGERESWQETSTKRPKCGLGNQNTCSCPEQPHWCCWFKEADASIAAISTTALAARKRNFGKLRLDCRPDDNFIVEEAFKILNWTEKEDSEDEF